MNENESLGMVGGVSHEQSRVTVLSEPTRPEPGSWRFGRVALRRVDAPIE
jgi:hypothetical protein